jgi:hypothetical protein
MAADEDNWGLCVLLVDEALDAAELVLLLPRAATRIDGDPSVVRLLPSASCLHLVLQAVYDKAQRGSLAVDVPFGWPVEHATFTANWNATSKLRDGALPSRDDFERRLGDQEFRHAFDGLMPFAVGADSIAQAAFVWCKTLHKLGELAGSIDVGVTAIDSAFATFETYPAAFVRNVAPKYVNYKSIPEQRAALLTSLIETDYRLRFAGGDEACGIPDNPWCRWAIQQCGSPDAFDALLCAFTAWDHLRFRFGTMKPVLSTPEVVMKRQLGNQERERIAREGWILVRMPEQ